MNAALKFHIIHSINSLVCFMRVPSPWSSSLNHFDLNSFMRSVDALFLGWGGIFGQCMRSVPIENRERSGLLLTCSSDNSLKTSIGGGIDVQTTIHLLNCLDNHSSLSATGREN